jgi:hypothetical protein
VAAAYVAPAAAVPVTQPSSLVALLGTWEQTSLSTVSTTPNISTVPGSEVPPSLAALTDFYWISTYANVSAAKVNAQAPGFNVAFSNIVPNATGFTYTISFSGSGIYAGYSSTSNYTVSIPNYVGCGSCGVGSTVSITYTSATVGGTQTTPAGTTNVPASTSSGTDTWVRKS